MRYINKNTGETISETVYKQLSSIVQDQYIMMVEDPKKMETVHTIVEHKDDHATVGDALTVIALTPLLLLSRIF
jgi:uncharacterized protein YdeI (YjbR/CyaY-like superfamily)